MSESSTTRGFRCAYWELERSVHLFPSRTVGSNVAECGVVFGFGPPVWESTSVQTRQDGLDFGAVRVHDHNVSAKSIGCAAVENDFVNPEPDSQEYKLIGCSRHVVLVAEDVVANFQEWSKRGVRFHRPPEAQTWGGMETSFEDPDGNSLVLVGYDAATREFEAQRRAAQELEIAKQVQGRLFPQVLPHLPSLDYTGICIQARQVGGDYYDFLNLSQGRLGLVIGDIAGKGIAAALLMANLQANLRSQCVIAFDQPQQLLRSVNKLFCENTTDGAFATLLFAEYDDSSGRLRYGNCGHLSALLLRSNDSLEQLHSTGTVLGVFREWDCLIEERRLFSGDSFALYTDGITESFNDAGEEFGVHRLIESLRRHREQPSAGLVASIVNDVKKFSPHEQSDDITLIVAKVR